MKNDLNIREAVLYASQKINNGFIGFTVNTTFGKVAVEMNPYHEIDPLHAVTALPWMEAPQTDWVRKHQMNCDFYVSLDQYGTEFHDRNALIEAFVRCILLKNKVMDADDSTIHAAVKAYLVVYDEVIATNTAMMQEFMDCHANLFARMNPAIQSAITELYRMRNNQSDDILKDAGIILKQCNLSICDFYDEFAYTMFGLVLLENKNAGREVQRPIVTTNKVAIIQNV